MQVHTLTSCCALQVALTRNFNSSGRYLGADLGGLLEHGESPRGSFSRIVDILAQLRAMLQTGRIAGPQLADLGLLRQQQLGKEPLEKNSRAALVGLDGAVSSVVRSRCGSSGIKRQARSQVVVPLPFRHQPPQRLPEQPMAEVVPSARSATVVARRSCRDRLAGGPSPRLRADTAEQSSALGELLRRHDMTSGLGCRNGRRALVGSWARSPVRRCRNSQEASGSLSASSARRTAPAPGARRLLDDAADGCRRVNVDKQRSRVST